MTARASVSKLAPVSESAELLLRELAVLAFVPVWRQSWVTVPQRQALAFLRALAQASVLTWALRSELGSELGPVLVWVSVLIWRSQMGRLVSVSDAERPCPLRPLVPDLAQFDFRGPWCFR